MKQRFRVEREFGLIVGGVFILLSAWWFYRGKFVNVTTFTVSLGALLMLLGLVWPRALVYPNKAWMLLAAALSFVSTRIILALVFFLIVTPIGVSETIVGLGPFEPSQRQQRFLLEAVFGATKKFPSLRKDVLRKRLCPKLRSSANSGNS